ncbi:hypothetical protein SEVIR_8G125600v4 [Setaria viridis]|uniref:Hydrophobic seed protein domain-containing protein n=1 Tax=Setaria viridis TaxID=4556 RepID=A0A4U6TEM7_SETVI|nr:hypothetical protein SEVIR_8G125600v2 [Setaria viridis]
MAKNSSTSVQLLLVLLVLLVVVSGILAQGGPSTCNSPEQHECPPIPGQGN